MAGSNQIAERLTAFSSARTNTANTSSAMVSPDKILFFKELDDTHVGKTFKVFSKGIRAPGSNEPSYTNEGSRVLNAVGGLAPAYRSTLGMRTLVFNAIVGNAGYSGTAATQPGKQFDGRRTDFETSFVVKEYEDAHVPVQTNEDPSRRRRNRKSRRRHRGSRRSTRRRRN
jgi:hypothetical protein